MCWAQLMLEQALHSYAEITPSGYGCESGAPLPVTSLHRKFELRYGRQTIAVELFRATNKALTISGSGSDARAAASAISIG